MGFNFNHPATEETLPRRFIIMTSLADASFDTPSQSQATEACLEGGQAAKGPCSRKRVRGAQKNQFEEAVLHQCGGPMGADSQSHAGAIGSLTLAETPVVRAGRESQTSFAKGQLHRRTTAPKSVLNCRQVRDVSSRKPIDDISL